MLRKLTLSATALGAALLLTAACGSSSDDSDKGGAGDGGNGASAGSGGSNSSGGSNTGGLGLGGLGLGGDNSAGGSSNGSGGSSNDCGAESTPAKLTPANLLFVLDRSGSMNCNPPEFDPEHDAKCETFPEKRAPSQPSKWELTTPALSDALESLVGASNVSVGVTVFPKPDPVLQCSVSEAPDVTIQRLTAAHKANIDTFLNDVTPDGKTPLAGATILSYKYLSEQLKAGELEGNTFVILLTDGAETCTTAEVSQAFVDTDVENATLFNIKTFVIGAPGSAPGRAMLSEVSFNGLTATSTTCSHGGSVPDVGDCHFDMTTSTNFAGDLSAALEAITNDRALSCVFDVPEGTSGKTVDLNKVNVTFTSSTGKSTKVLKDDTKPCTGADSAEGWQYTKDRSKIVLCGSICDDVKQDNGGEVEITLGCPTEIVVK